MILHFVTDNCTGGAQRLVADIVNNTNDHKTLFFKRNRYVDVISFNESKIISHDSIFSPKTVLKLIRIYREIRLVHVHLFPCMYLAIIIFPFKKKIFTEHSSKNRRSQSIFWRIIDRKIYSLYSKVIAISHSVKEALIMRGIPENSIEVIHNGIDKKRFTFKNSSSSSKVNIGMASRFVESKAHMNLISSMKFLPARFCLHLAGDGKLLQQCINLVAKSNLEDRVIFHGNVNNMKKFYSKIDIYVQASFWEGFGLTVVEANFSGVPVAYSCIDGLKEILGVTEASFDPHSFKDISRSINYINNNRVLIFKNQCFKLEPYTLENHLKRLNILYEQFI